jgi:hypothetical protein
VGTAAREDPLGWAVVHGDLHAANTVASADGPVQLDLELWWRPAFPRPRSRCGRVRRYGATAGGFEALLSDDGDDPRRWPGFETFCQVYELWVTAWALGQTQLRLGRRRRRACRNARRPRWQLW